MPMDVGLADLLRKHGDTSRLPAPRPVVACETCPYQIYRFTQGRSKARLEAARRIALAVARETCAETHIASWHLEKPRWGTIFLAVRPPGPRGQNAVRYMVGGVGFVKNHRKTVEIGALCSHDRQGRRLVEMILASGKASGATQAKLDAVSGAVPFWEKMGFHRTSQPNKSGETLMAKKL